MAVLHNRVSQAELKKRLYEETEPRITLSFYKYFYIESTVNLRDELYKGMNALKVFGRIYIAHEGINAQLSVPRDNLSSLKDILNGFEHLADIRLNFAVDETGKGSFWVLKIKVRDKIVADGITDPSFNMESRGRYVDAAAFNRLTEDESTIVVDMRNHYEYEVGHFDKAIEIPSDTFREQLPMAAKLLEFQKDKNIIMYCTGGIRCEKASAYMLYRGFKNVFHLEGGIIHYVNTVKTGSLPNKFRGKNFVFDDRLGERVTDEILAHCHQCNEPSDTHTNCRNEACHLLFIQCSSCAEKFQGCCSEECLNVIKLPDDVQKELRKGIEKGRMVFNKSRHRIKKV